MNFYKSEKYNLAVSIDQDNEIVLMYDCHDGLVNLDTEGILQELENEIYDEVCKYFGIDIAKYGVKRI